MKIALVVHDVSKQKGHDRYVAELASALADDHEVHIFACSCRDVDTGRIVFHRVPAITWPDLMKMISFPLMVAWKLKGCAFDIIHAQGASALNANIVTAHFTQGRWEEVEREINTTGVSRLRRIYHGLVIRIMKKMEGLLYRSNGLRRVIALSEQVKNDLIRFYGCAPDKIRIIYNGINTDEFHPDHIARYHTAVRREIGVPPDAFVLLYVGEFQRKGLRYAIEALSYIDISNVLLVVAGGGETRPYRDMARQYGIENRVFFIGHQTQINRFYAMSDVVVFPTLYEPFGFTITEAMATGIPVITSAAAGAAEIMEHGLNGLLVENPRNAREIAGQILRLIEDTTLRQTIGQNARLRVESLAWRQFAEKVERVYREAIEGS